MIKFIYSEKATKFYEISTLLLSYVVPVKSKVEISQNFVAFSEYMNFNWWAHSDMKSSISIMEFKKTKDYILIHMSYMGFTFQFRNIFVAQNHFPIRPCIKYFLLHIIQLWQSFWFNNINSCVYHLYSFFYSLSEVYLCFFPV